MIWVILLGGGLCLPVRSASPDDPRAHEKVGTTVKNSVGMTLTYIPAGEFTMGSPANEEGHINDQHQHRVRLTRPFYLGATEVTQQQYETVMGRNPATSKGANLPVESVTWYDCIAFCNKLSEREGKRPCYRLTSMDRTDDGSLQRAQVERLTDGTGYRLPTEAEWEYACRAGTTTPFHYGDSLDATQANFNGNYPYGTGAKGEYRRQSTPVGSFAPNPWGLYDMHGNVCEWCLDSYDEDFYHREKGSVTNPVNEQVSSLRVVRGGSWQDSARACRSASRGSWNAGNLRQFKGLGFRVVFVFARTP